jgi:ABC-type phosphate/phosphonate transport system substrate-binding protein
MPDDGVPPGLANGQSKRTDTMSHLRAWGAATAALALFLGSYPSGAADANRNNTVRIGLVNTLFHDLPDSMLQLMLEPFGALMHSQTGIHGELVSAGDCRDLVQRLKEDKVQLGVFNGVEFGWAQQEQADLKPLMIAVNKHPKSQAFLVVRNDSTATSFSDLQGKVLALPRRSRDHCHLFLQRQCRYCGSDPKRFFSQIATPAGPEVALDDLVRGKLQACVVDNLGLESYKHEKPGCYDRLKTLKESEAFPAVVVAYLPGTLDEATLQRFRDGMSRANQTLVGRQLLSSCRLTRFEPIPADYQKQIAEIIKAYPPDPVVTRAETQPMARAR